MQLLFLVLLFHHVDLKGDFNDPGTVPHQENIFAPRSSFCLFFYIHVYFHTVVRFLTAQKYNQAFLDVRPGRVQRWSSLWDDFSRHKVQRLQCSVTPFQCHSVLAFSAHLDICVVLCSEVCSMFMSDCWWKHFFVRKPFFFFRRNWRNDEFAGMNLAKASFIDGFPDLFFYHLHCTILFSC